MGSYKDGAKLPVEPTSTYTIKKIHSDNGQHLCQKQSLLLMVVTSPIKYR